MNEYNLYNMYGMMDENCNYIFIVNVFVYIFIIMIFLILIVNVFNIILINIKLCCREFVMFCFVGMFEYDF